MRADVVVGAVFPDYELTDHPSNAIESWLLSFNLRQPTVNQRCVPMSEARLPIRLALCPHQRTVQYP